MTRTIESPGRFVVGPSTAVGDRVPFIEEYDASAPVRWRPQATPVLVPPAILAGLVESPSLSVRVELDGDYLVASDTTTGIFGVGETLADTFSDLARALGEHRDLLERQPQLSPGLAAQLEYLRRRLPA